MPEETRQEAPVKVKESKIFRVEFTESRKDMISGLDMLDFIAGLVFQEFGKNTRLGEVSFKFPAGLGKNEPAILRLTYAKKQYIPNSRTFLGVLLAVIRKESGIVVLKGSATIIAED
jgi:hypothetical protein